MVEDKVIENPETIATAIRIGNPVNRKKAKLAVKESKGLLNSITDQQIKQAHYLLSSKEGVFVEPASAAPVAGLIKLAEKEPNLIKDKTIVAVLTGNGLKDQEFVLENYDIPNAVEGNLNSVENILRL
jgi:threonine synthase